MIQLDYLKTENGYVQFNVTDDKGIVKPILLNEGRCKSNGMLVELGNELVRKGKEAKLDSDVIEGLNLASRYYSVTVDGTKWETAKAS